MMVSTNTEQTLLHRIIDLGACMGNRGSTKTGFIGEDAAGNTLLYGGEHGAYYAAGHSGGIERALNDGGERHREIPDVNNDNAKTQHHIQKRHNGNQTLCHMTDALDAAQQDHADQNSNNNAENEIEGGGAAGFHYAEADERGINGGNDGIDLRSVTGAEYRKYTENGKQYA